MIVMTINGYPGVGKATVGRILSKTLGARFIENHSFMGPAFALFDPGSTDWHALVDAVREATLFAALHVAPETTLIFTNILAEGDFRDFVLLERLQTLAQRRATRFIAVTLTSDEETRQVRMTDPSRTGHKLTDWQIGARIPGKFELMGTGQKAKYWPPHIEHFEIETSARTARQTAAEILRRLQSDPKALPGSGTLQ